MALKDKHPEFLEMSDRWQRCRDAAEGESAVHQQAETYLPRLEDEEDAPYNLRKSMTPFFNATWRTIVGLKGMIFRKAPTVDLPAKIVPFMDDVDLAGTTMLGLAQEVVEEALTVGRVGLLVDYPVIPAGLTAADVKLLGARTMGVVYEAESIFNWKVERIHGVQTLTQVRLFEEFEEVDGEFSSSCKTQIRVLDLFEGAYRQRIFRDDLNGDPVQFGDDIFPLINNQKVPFIPFVFIGVDCVGPDVDAPPLIDLVTTNFHHYQQATSYERGCFFSGLPTMFISGMDSSDKPIAIGGNLANALGNPNAKAYYVEVTSRFEALRTNLEDKKREMAVLGARMLEGGKSGGQTEAAETVARRQSGEESVLSSMSQTVTQGLEKFLQWFCLWEGVEADVKYELNKDFLPMSMSAQELSALVQAWQSGAISPQVLFQNLQQGEIIAADDTYEIEQDRIANQGMGTIPNGTTSA